MPARGQTTGNVTGEETRAVLIDAATSVFIEEGFKAARVADIAERAGVRLSAINYHFGGKDGLYRAVLTHHADLAVRHTPVEPAATGQAPRQRLHFFVRAMLTRLLDERHGSRIAALMAREIASPTPALDELFERFSRPQAGILVGLLHDILGEHADADTVRRALFSLMGQCLVYRIARPMVEKLDPALFRREHVVEHLAEHITVFSWAGLQAMRKQERSTA